MWPQVSVNVAAGEDRRGLQVGVNVALGQR